MLTLVLKANELIEGLVETEFCRCAPRAPAPASLCIRTGWGLWAGTLVPLV